MAAFTFLPAHFSAIHLFLIGALGLSLLFAPYICKTSTEDSVWHYNYLNFITLLIAGIATLLLGLGLCAIIASIDYLFEIYIPEGIYGDIWISAGCLFFPLYLLTQFAKKFDFEKKDCYAPRSIFFIANYLQVPLMLIYTLVLYAYSAKIALKWELPRGNLAYMVTAFGTIGVLTHLVIYPMLQDGTKLLQKFHKHFYKILIIPLVLLAIGIYTRIHEYGLTEERYAIVLCLLWLSGISIFYSLRPQQWHIKYVPMVLAILCLLATVGPWSAVNLSTTSQTARLKALLIDAGVLQQNGKIVKTNKDVSFADRSSMSSVLDYLHTRDRIQKITAWIPSEIETSDICYQKTDLDIPCFKSYETTKKIMAGWGMVYVKE